MAEIFDPFAENGAPAAPAPKVFDPFEQSANISQPRNEADYLSGFEPPPKPTPEPNSDVGRLGTAVGQALRGAGHVISSVPKSLALADAYVLRRNRKVLDWMDRIDRGEKFDPYADHPDLPGDAISHLGSYSSGNPEWRNRMRAETMRTISSGEATTPGDDPRQSKVYRAGEAIDKAVEGAKRVNPKYAEEFWSGKLPQGVGSTFGFLLAAPAGPAGIAGAGALAGSVEGFEDAINNGATLDQALSSSGWAALVGTSEAVPISHALNRLDRVTGGTAKRAIASMLKQGTEEAVQEAFQQISQNLIASDVVGYDPKRQWYQGSGESAAVGFGSGALMDFLFTVAAGGRRGKPARQAQPPQSDIYDPFEETRALPAPVVEVTPEGVASTAAQRQDFGMEDIAEAEIGRAPIRPEPAPSADDILSQATVSPGVTTAQAIDQSVGVTEPPSRKEHAARGADLRVAMREQVGVSPDKETQVEKSLSAADYYARQTHTMPDGTVMPGATHEEVTAKSEEVSTSLVDQAAAQAATSPQNNLPEPTAAQKEAGTYKKGHVKVNGIDIAIENPAGTKRRPEWPPLANHYGYIKRTEGKDGDHVDVFLGPKAEDAKAPVFIVDQISPETGKFDEHKVVLGASSEQEARAIYAANYSKDWHGLGAIKQFTLPEFKLWLKAGNTKKPVAYKRPAVAKTATTTANPATSKEAISVKDLIAESTLAGKNDAGEVLYDNKRGRFRIRHDRNGYGPDGYADFGGNLAPARESATSTDRGQTGTVDKKVDTSAQVSTPVTAPKVAPGAKTGTQDVAKKATTVAAQATPKALPTDEEAAKMSLDEFHAATRDHAMRVAPGQPESWYKAQAKWNHENILKRAANKSSVEDNATEAVKTVADAVKEVTGAVKELKAEVAELRKKPAEAIKSEIEKIGKLADQRRDESRAKNPNSPDAPGAGIDYLKSDERARLHELKQQLPSQAEERVAAKERIAKRIADRKQKSEPKKAEAKPAKKIGETYGEELTYNARNRLGRGITWSDVESLNDALKTKEVVKSKVWPRPDYQAIVDAGMPALTAHIVKQVYDSIATSPNVRGTPTDADMRNYIDGINRVRDAVFKWADDRDAQAQFGSAMAQQAGAAMGRSKISMTDLVKSATALRDYAFKEGIVGKAKEELIAIGGRKVWDVLSPGFNEAMRAAKDTSKGWPGKQEVWQRQGMKIVSKGEAAKISEGRNYAKDGKTFVNSYNVEIDRGWARDRSFDSREQAQAYIDNLKPFLLTDKYGKLLGQFDTRNAAAEAAREATKREGGKVIDRRIEFAETTRKGPAHRRPSENITPDRLRETFGFRGVNFGNWTNQKERQAYVNAAYDALMDLSEVLGVPAKAMSLDGLLGLAFGAQGKGKAAAHFVPGVNEINLTRTSGAGALAHEWGHALDHYFAVQAGHARSKEPFMTSHRRAVQGTAVRPEIVDAFKNIYETMTKRPQTEAEAKLALDDRKAKAKKNLDGWIKSTRRDLEANSKATEKDRALKEFDQLGERLLRGDTGEGHVQLGRQSFVSQAVGQVRALYQDATGRAPMLDYLKGLDANAGYYKTLLNKKGQDQVHVPQATSTDYFKEASKLNADAPGMGKGYWTEPTELFARAFETYVLDQLEAQARVNDYLTHPLKNNQPAYPQGAERKAINKAFDKLIDTIETKETEKGVALFSRRRDQTQTPEFKKWFEGSDVVDSYGRPLVVYHGTNADFSEFKKGKGVISTVLGTEYVDRHGFFFTENQESAELFAVQHGDSGANMVPVYLNIKNPLDIRDGIGVGIESQLSAEGFPSRILLNVRDQWELFDGEIGAHFVRAAEAAGYDGAFIVETDQKTGRNMDVYVAFRPEQIKSAIGNRGTFDPNDPNILYSRARTITDDDTMASTVFTLLAQNDETFQLPASSAKSMSAIARDVFPDIKVDEWGRDVARGYNLRGNKAWTFTLTHKGQSQTATAVELPGGEIYLNISEFQKGGGGNRVYAIVANYARNNGKVFIGDPYGLSDSAMLRRTSNMVSTALKFGTTDHIQPHERQLEGSLELGIPPIDWEVGNDAKNINSLLEAESYAVLKAVPEVRQIVYNFQHERFENQSGEPVGDDVLAAIGGRARLKGAAIGVATIKRAVLVQSAMSEVVQGQTGQSGLLAKVAALSGRADLSSAQLNDILYSKQKGRPSDGLSSVLREALTDGVAENLKAKAAALEEDAGPGSFKITSGQLLDDLLASGNPAAQTAGLQLLKTLQDTFGAPVAIVTHEGPFSFNGVFYKGLIWLDANSAVSLPNVFGHELSHRLEADNPAAYNALLESVAPLLRNLSRYEELNSLQNFSDRYILKEMLGDILGDRFAEPEFWQQVAAGTNETTFQKIVTSIRMLLDKLLNRIRGFDSHQFVSDLNKARAILANAVRNYAQERQTGIDAQAQGAPMFSGEAKAPTFYSALERGIANAKQAKAPAADWKAIVPKLPGVKADEIEATGLNEWLDMQQGQVTKEAVLEFVRQNGVQVKEVELGNVLPPLMLDDFDDVSDRIEDDETGVIGKYSYSVPDSIKDEIEYIDLTKYEGDEWEANVNGNARSLGKGSMRQALTKLEKHIESVTGRSFGSSSNESNSGVTKFSSYQLPGGENYRELLLTLPADLASIFEVRQKGSGFGVWNTKTEDWATTTLNKDVAEDGARKLNLENTKGTFKSGHFDEPNILAHIRFNERTDAEGKRVLFIEEVQSDWAQKGRKEGFADAGARNKARIKELLEQHESLRLKIESENRNPTQFEAEQFAIINAEDAELRRAVTSASNGGIPPAPFVTKTESWTLLAMKRMIRYAAENGFDRIAWTTGDQQNIRYKEALLKAVDSVTITKWPDGNYEYRATKDGRGVTSEESVPAARVQEVFGKAGDELIKAADEKPGKDVTVQSQDMTIGGAGMRAFYDQMLPQVVNKYVKKWGGKVGEAKIPAYTPSQKYEGFKPNLLDSHSLDITPALRESVMHGQPLFSRKKTHFGDLTKEQEQALRNTGGIVEQRTIREWWDDTKPRLKTKLAQAVADQFAPLKELNPHAYLLARMSKGSDGALEALLHFGNLHLNQGVTDTKAGGKGFIDSLQSLQGEQHRFFWWVAAHRAEQLAKEDREHLFGDADIKALKTLNRGRMPDGKNREAVYLETLRDYTRASKNVLDIAEQSGIIDPESRAIWEKEMYVPFYRAMEDGFSGPSFGKKPGLVRQYAFKKLKGGTDKLNTDLLANVLLNWSHLLSASAKNRAARVALPAAEAAGAAQAIPVEQKGAVYYLDRGEKRWYAVDDPLVLDALTSLEYAGFSGPAMQALSSFKRWLTIGVTANPAFKVRNLMRDSIAAIGQTELGYNPLANVAEGVRAMSEKGQTYASLLASGGIIRFGTMLEGNRATHVDKLINAGVDANTIVDTQEKALDMLQKAWDYYNEAGDISEGANRAALYQQLRAKGVSHAEAAYQARDLLDFSMGGTSKAIRFLIQTVPFFNARVQGLYKLARAGQANPKRLGAVLGATALVSIALMLAYQDDEDWKRREDWDRDNYWWFKIGGVAFRIPKPFEIGVIATLAERSVELFVDPEMTGKRYFERLRFAVEQTLSFNPVPQLFKPVIDLYANKDSFTGRDIETAGMEKLPKSERYGSRTSEFAKIIGQAGDYTGLSPAQADHLIRGYFGWLGTAATTALDTMVNPLQDEPAAPETKLRDWFLVGNFAETLPSTQSRYITQFYDQALEIEQAYADYRNKMRSGDREGAKELYENDRDRLSKHGIASRGKEAMSNINQRIRQIELSDKLTPSEKRLKIDELIKRKEDIAQRALSRF